MIIRRHRWGLVLGVCLLASAGRAASSEPAAVLCAATSTDEECAAYWEQHINWFSWDYRASPTQQPEHRHMPPPFAFAFINFAVFAAIIYRLAAKPLREAVLSRHLKIKQDLESAAEFNRLAGEKLRLCQDKLAGIDATIDALVESVRQQANAEKARLLASAQEEAARLKRDAEKRMAQEFALVREELRREVIEAALQAALQILRAKVQPSDQQALAEKSVAGLEALPPEHDARPV